MIVTAEEFLSRAEKIEKRINLNLREIERWRELSYHISGCSLEPKYNSNRNTEAPFTKCIDEITVLEQKVSDEIKELITLKAEIIFAIHNVEELHYRELLELRYIDCLTWKQIAEKLNADSSTVRRWHKKALEKIILPDNYKI